MRSAPSVAWEVYAYAHDRKMAQVLFNHVPGRMLAQIIAGRITQVKNRTGATKMLPDLPTPPKRDKNAKS